MARAKIQRRRKVRAPAVPAVLAASAVVAEPAIDVFVSYARADQAIAVRVVEMLRSEGFDVWFDEKLKAGAVWKRSLVAMLARAKAVLVLWSENSVKRPWVQMEADVAMKSNRLVPAELEPCEVPTRFTSRQIAKLHGWDGVAPHPELERLLAGLAQLAPPSRIETVRPGYDAAFLGVPVEMPEIPGVADEFRYLHFSVVMNPGRRLAWFTAYNTAPTTEVARGDRWLPDPSLPRAFQPQNEHFRGTGFDRGHLVSPRTVSWGTERQAQLANRQSFFWTNTAPQHPHLNQRWWLCVEQWERDLVASRGKLVGFAGPVLAGSDRAQGERTQTIGRLRLRENFRVPSRFWKVVVAAGAGGGLEVAAFLWDQDALVKTAGKRACKPADFVAALTDVEAATGLVFGPELHAAAALSTA